MLKVLRALLSEPGAELYGLEILRRTGLKSGTVYPLLDRLEAAGLAESYWEEIDPTDEGRPRRRFYRLTGAGVHEGRQMLIEHGVGAVAWGN